MISNTLAEMQRVADLVEQFGTHFSLPQKAVNELNICLDELINNTISYGYDDNGTHEIAVELGFAQGIVTAQIRDDGRFFDPRAPAAVPPESDPQFPRIGGLGLHFVQSLMDEVSYMRTGQDNVVKIMKRVQ